MATTDTERYVRITLLTFEGGIWISRTILFRELDRTAGSPDIDTMLGRQRPRLLQMRNTRVITKPQFEILLPPSGDKTNVDEWDLSLLSKIIMFLFETALSGNDKSDLKEIIRIRNEVICHARHPSLEERSFLTYWTQVTTSMSRLASTFGEDVQKVCTDMIQKLNRGPLDLQSSIEKLAQLCRNDELKDHVLDCLRRIERTQNTIASGVVSANNKLDDVLAKLSRLQELKEHGQRQTDVPMLNSKVVVSGQKEDDVYLAKEIILKVFQSAIKQAYDPMDNANVRNEVIKFLDNLTSKGAVAQSAESGSIIFILKCFDLDGLANILTWFIREGNRCRLVGIEHALINSLAVKLEVVLVLPDDTIETLSTWIDKCLSLSQISSTVQCSFPGCEYKTADLDAQIVAELIKVHGVGHTPAPAPGNLSKVERVCRPTITDGGTREDWAYFKSRWSDYVDATKVDDREKVIQLLECCDEPLHKDLIRSEGDSIKDKTETEVLAAIHKLAVRVENTFAARNILHNMRQDRNEPVRRFGVRLRRQAGICKFVTECPSCHNNVNYTDVIMRDVLTKGIADRTIQSDLLSNPNQEMTLEEMFQFVEQNEDGQRAASSLFDNQSMEADNKRENNDTTKKDNTMAHRRLRINNNNDMANLMEGDLIEFERDNFSHWGVYTGDGTIVHLTGFDDDPIQQNDEPMFLICGRRFNRACVQEDKFWDVASGSISYRNNTADSDLQPQPTQTVVAEARSQIGNVRRNDFTRSCEAFAKFCRYGRQERDVQYKIPVW